MLSFHVNRNYKQPVVEVFENIDAAHKEDFFNVCIDISRNYEKVFIKFHDNMILTSKMIGLIVQINEAVDSAGKDLYVYGVNEKSQKILDLMRLTTFLNISTSNEMPL